MQLISTFGCSNYNLRKSALHPGTNEVPKVSNSRGSYIGETVKELDVAGNEVINQKLKNCRNVAAIASEENDEPIDANANAPFVSFPPPHVLNEAGTAFLKNCLSQSTTGCCA